MSNNIQNTFYLLSTSFHVWLTHLLSSYPSKEPLTPAKTTRQDDLAQSLNKVRKASKYVHIYVLKGKKALSPESFSAFHSSMTCFSVNYSSIEMWNIEIEWLSSWDIFLLSDRSSAQLTRMFNKQNNWTPPRHYKNPLPFTTRCQHITDTSIIIFIGSQPLYSW